MPYHPPRSRARRQRLASPRVESVEPRLLLSAIGADGALWFTESHAQAHDQRELPPQPPSGGLDPASDTGLSNSDGVTADNTPTFVGLSGPGDLVQLFVQQAGTGNLVPIAATHADATGHWQATASAPLSDAAYFAYALATRSSDGQAVASPLQIGGQGMLWIDTQGPTITDTFFLPYDVTFWPHVGDVRIAYHDALGNLDPSTLTRNESYQITIGRAVFPTRSVMLPGVGSTATIQPPPDSSPPPHDRMPSTVPGYNVYLQLVGTPPRRGRLLLTIDPEAITDLAGNPLQVPGSGNGHAPGPYRVVFAFAGPRASRPFLLRPPLVRRHR